MKLWRRREVSVLLLVGGAVALLTPLPLSLAQSVETAPAAPFEQPAGTECGAETAQLIPWNWCVYRTPGSKNPDVVWYLHGRGGDEFSWAAKKEYGEIRHQWATLAAAPPTVINVTFGTQWLLVSKNSTKRSGLLEYFQRTVIPAMEAKLGGLKGRRMLLGESMGGFSATELLLSREVKWDKVALACPALAWVSPWASWGKMLAWTWKNRVNPVITISILMTVRPFFDRQAKDWEKLSPLALAATHLDKDTPPLLITIGQQDSYGFYSGVHDFYEIAAKQSGSRVEWAPVKGHHCSMDSDAIARFLAP